MSMMYCEDCDKHIDTDFDAEHFDDHDPLTGEHSTLALASSRDVLKKYKGKES